MKEIHLCFQIRMDRLNLFVTASPEVHMGQRIFLAKALAVFLQYNFSDTMMGAKLTEHLSESCQNHHSPR